MSLSLQKLRNFVIVAEERQFLRASQRVGVSQPTLSAQIKELETELGVPLFSRTTRQVHLTIEGERFLARIRQILFDLEIAVTEAREQAALKHGRITIAATPSLAASVLPPLIAEFHTSFPEIDVRLVEEISQTVDNMVRTGVADFGIGPSITRQADLLFSPLFQERFFALVPAGHPLSDARAIPVAALPERELITVGKGTGIRDVIERALRDNGLDMGSPHVLTRVDTVVSMVEAGLGVGLLPELSLPRPGREKLHIIPVVDPEIVRSVGLIERKGGSSSSAATSFLGKLRTGRLFERFSFRY
ncbi:LysR family transcriptional regulator [Rhizobiaceae sp. 2RAB30]